MIQCECFHLDSGPAENVTLITVSSSRLRLRWQKPSNTNAEITGYDITWKMVSNDKKQNVNGRLMRAHLARNKSLFVITDLSTCVCFVVYRVL